MQDTIAIIGAGQAGAQTALSLRQSGHQGPIVLFGDEDHPPYQRPPLSKKFLSGDMEAEGLWLRPDAFYEKNDISLRLSSSVRSLNVSERVVALEDGSPVPFDRAVLATGTRARMLSLPGAELAGVVTLRGIGDVEVIRELLSKPCKVAIIGAGYIGLEVAAVARSLGHEVCVLEGRERAMQRVVSPLISRFYEKLHREQGVDLRFGAAIEALEGEERVQAVRLAGGERIACDLVLAAVGAAPNDEIAAEAGLEVDDGVLVDAGGATSDPAIFAVGDCTRFYSGRYRRSIRLESVQNAIDQAKITAKTMTGADEDYDPIPWFWSDQYHVKLQIAGLSQGYDEVRAVGDVEAGAFYVAYLKDEQLIAVDSVNHPRSHMMARRHLGERWRDDLLPPA